MQIKIIINIDPIIITSNGQTRNTFWEGGVKGVGRIMSLVFGGWNYSISENFWSIERNEIA